MKALMVVTRHFFIGDPFVPLKFDLIFIFVYFRAIDENREDLAAFLIRCGCDLNSARKIGPDGRGGDEAHDLASPLHLCCQWGLELVVQALLEHGANKNSKVSFSHAKVIK